MKKIFVSYSHQNQDWVVADGKYALISWMEKQLLRYDIKIWTDHALKKLPGEEYNKLITREINEADMAILMISQEFVASEYIMEKEVPLIKQLCQNGKIKIMPLLLTRISDRDKKEFSWIFDFQIYPNDTTPLIKKVGNVAEWEEAKVDILDSVFNRLESPVVEKKSDTDVNQKTKLDQERLQKEKEELEKLRQQRAEQQRLEEERKKIQAEKDRLKKELEQLRQQIAGQQRIEEERKKNQAEKERLEKELVEKKRIAEEAERKRLAAIESENKTVNKDFTLNVNGVNLEMVAVEGGIFWMGAQSKDINGRNYDKDAEDDESPVHQVTLSNYNIGKYPVTQALWKVVMGNNPSGFKGDNLPVENVSWDDCQDFIRELNNMTGKNFRLPTEAEWEYAARGGTSASSAGNKYSGSNSIDKVAWYTGNSGSKTHPVGTKSPNELGIYDMSGNVWEWCQDWLGDYSSGNQTNPTGPSLCYYRVTRGGSWDTYARYCRVSYRNYNTPYSYNNLGFRLASQ